MDKKVGIILAEMSSILRRWETAKQSRTLRGAEPSECLRRLCTLPDVASFSLAYHCQLRRVMTPCDTTPPDCSSRSPSTLRSRTVLSLSMLPNR